MYLFRTMLIILQVTFILCKLPAVHKCSLTDSKCIKSSGQQIVPLLFVGVPELDVPSLDPMYVKLIKVDLAGLKLNMKDSEIVGLKDSIIDKLSVDMAKKQINLVFHVDVNLKGKYKASGKLILLPISGDGDYTMTLKNIEIQVTYTFDIVKGDNGKEVIDLNSQKFNYDVRGNAHYYLGNLFNGNKELSDVLLNFMNQNWKLISQEFGDPVLEQPMRNIFNLIKKILKTQPLEDMII